MKYLLHFFVTATIVCTAVALNPCFEQGNPEPNACDCGTTQCPAGHICDSSQNQGQGACTPPGNSGTNGGTNAGNSGANGNGGTNGNGGPNGNSGANGNGNQNSGNQQQNGNRQQASLRCQSRDGSLLPSATICQNKIDKATCEAVFGVASGQQNGDKRPEKCDLPGK